jgi:hypothetical protein
MHEILVDHEDEWLLAERKWYVQRSSSSDTLLYAARGQRIEGKYVRLLLHRVITGAKPGQVVDHVNGNGLDCRRSNLRICSQAENMRNRRMHKNNRSGFKGVWKNGGRYVATIRANKVKHNLGSFGTPEEAHRAYVAAALNLHGEFARTN